MNDELKILESILSKSCNQTVDIKDESHHYFYFQNINNNEDLEKAWSVFPEHQAIRQKFLNIKNSEVFHAPKMDIKDIKECKAIDEAQFKKIVKSNILNLRKIIYDHEEYTDILAFIDAGFNVEIATSDILTPDAVGNHLFSVLYESLSDYVIDHFPYHKPHYEVLRNWAIYLTKCDEIAAYLLWPCLQHEQKITDDLIDNAFKLWQFNCRSNFWIKDNNTSTGVVYCCMT